ncbi:MAG: excinuclease ABC subunit UvrC [Candidatus Omnitrophica bacterium]|nr:excinuclease ABC subunit UvrC [Candidatus Omnitrophota bacterium]
MHIGDLKNKIAGLPDLPGVYLFRDSSGKVIYVGKAKSLKKRVQSYFSRLLNEKTQAMMAKVCDIEYRLSPSENQALILEASLIKDYQPQYNISLKDDKSFPFIKISDEEFPLVSIARRKKAEEKDNALYFGPYTDSGLLRKALKELRRIFGFRSCKKLPKSACLYYRLRLCPGPCLGKVTSGFYKETIERLKMFLDHKVTELTRDLSDKMQAASRARHFEEAARLRDQLEALSVIAGNAEEKSAVNRLEDLKNLLGLKKIPQRIEAFDVANISGKEATASMVSFYQGAADKDNYRRFRIKTVERSDDYAMIREAVSRRYSRIIREKRSLPDLVLIDGGKGHLFAAKKELTSLGLSLSIASIAKDRENIYIFGSGKPIRLTQDTPALNLIRQIRDEAHRFAQAYHHLLRRKKIIGK